MMMDSNSIIRMELLASEFWPARNRQVLSNGWILGENRGVTWRANCVLPYGVTHDLLDAIEDAERIYEAEGLPAAFKLTCAAPPRLGEILAKRGYERHMTTRVQIRALDSGEPPEMHSDEFRVVLSNRVKNEWLLKQTLDERYQGRRLDILRDLLERIPGIQAFAQVSEDKRLLGVGLGVIHKNWLALFSIRTDLDQRSRGIGRAISEALVYWGFQNGAANAFLQVEDNNRRALALYEKMGFVDAYNYWYRIKSGNEC